jgi:hypothetical protein
MIRVDVKDLKGDEILAVPVMSASDTVLVQSDTELKEEYIQKLTDHRLCICKRTDRQRTDCKRTERRKRAAAKENIQAG